MAIRLLPSAIRRFCWYNIGMSRPLFFYSDALLGYDMGPQHPLKPQRLRMTYDLLDSYGAFQTGLEVVEPQMASWEEAAQTHSRDYLEILSALDRGEDVRQARKYGFGTGDNPIFPHIYDVSLLYSGGSIDAAQAIMDGAGGGQVAFNMSGGLPPRALCQSRRVLRPQRLRDGDPAAAPEICPRRVCGH